jgi:MFS family permease
MLIFMISYAWYSIGAGMLSPAWMELLARCFPVQRRGRFLGTGIFLGTVTGVAGAALSTKLLSEFQFPRNFMIIFVLAAVAIIISWGFSSLIREPERRHKTPRRSQREFFASIKEILKKHHNYRRYLITRLIFGFGAMGSGFVTLSAIRSWDVSDEVVGVYTALVALVSLLAFSLVWIGPSAAYYYPAFLLLGIANGGFIVSGNLLTMEFADQERRPTFLGTINFGVGIAGMLAPLIGTAISAFSFSWIFALSAFLNLIALIGMHFWVQEPRFTHMNL